eukprot:SAG31_NODE_778_length_12161_cov_101.601807_10_plen_179_part_00
MIERRPGGETGLCAVRCVEGPDSIWAAATEGHWSPALAMAAAAADRTDRETADPTSGGRDGRTGDASDPEPVLASASDCEALLGRDGCAAILLSFSDGFTATQVQAHSFSHNFPTTHWAHSLKIVCGCLGYFTQDRAGPSERGPLLARVRRASKLSVGEVTLAIGQANRFRTSRMFRR